MAEMTVLENLRTLDESLHGIDALPALPAILGRHGEYFGHEWSNWRYDTLDRRVDRLLENHRIAGADILDIGCATGGRAVQWAEAGHQVTAVDVVDRTDAIRARNEGLSHPRSEHRTLTPIDFVHADIRLVPASFFARRFDLVHARRVVNFIAVDELNGLWDTIRSVLKNDGLFVVSLIAMGLDQDEAMSGLWPPSAAPSVPLYHDKIEHEVVRKPVPAVRPHALGPGIHAHHFGEVRSSLRDHGLGIVETFSDGQVEAGLIARAITVRPQASP